jgi:hypothetical protein
MLAQQAVRDPLHYVREHEIIERGRDVFADNAHRRGGADQQKEGQGIPLKCSRLGLGEGRRATCSRQGSRFNDREMPKERLQTSSNLATDFFCQIGFECLLFGCTLQHFRYNRRFKQLGGSRARRVVETNPTSGTPFCACKTSPSDTVRVTRE